MIFSNGSTGSFTGSGTTYTLDVTPAYSDTLIISIPTGAAPDPAGNQNTAAQFSIFYSTYPAVLSISPSEESFSLKDTLIQFHISDKLSSQTLTDENIIFSSLHSSSITHTSTFDLSSQMLSINLSNSLVGMDTISITFNIESLLRSPRIHS